jgi:hypothetical protein
MSFSGLADNQSVSYGNLQDAVNNGAFTLVSTIPSPSNRESTKSVVSASVSGFNVNYPPYADKANNQLIVKSDIYKPGNFILSPQYGMYFTGMSGTGLPSFTYNVTSQTTKQYNNQIPSQTFLVSLNGTRVTTPVRITLYVGGTFVSTQEITYNGTQTKTFTLSNTISAPTEIKISIETGSVPPTPPAPYFTNMPFSWAAISRNTGQYQLLAQTNNSNTNNSGFVKGYLYTSSDYGATWTTRTPYGYWNKVAVSGDGRYMLALEGSYGTNGLVWKSGDYGVSWTQITNFPAPPNRIPYGSVTVNPLQNQKWSGAALSSNGQIQYITSGQTIYTLIAGGTYTISVVWKSADYGATWSAIDVYSSSSSRQDDSVLCITTDSTGSYVYYGTGDVTVPKGWISYSSNGGSSFAISSGSDNPNGNYIDISTINDGSTIIATNFVNSEFFVPFSNLIKSTNYGANFSEITAATSPAISRKRWYRCSIYRYGSTEIDIYALYKDAIFYSLINSAPVNSAYPNGPVYEWPTSPSQFWNGIANSEDGTYVLAVTYYGVWRSANNGGSFTQL